MPPSLAHTHTRSHLQLTLVNVMKTRKYHPPTTKMLCLFFFLHWLVVHMGISVLRLSTINVITNIRNVQWNERERGRKKQQQRQQPHKQNKQHIKNTWNIFPHLFFCVVMKHGNWSTLITFFSAQYEKNCACIIFSERSVYVIPNNPMTLATNHQIQITDITEYFTPKRPRISFFFHNRR